LEGVDLPERALPFLLARETLHALHQHAPIPRAVEDGDLPSLGQAPPKAIEVVTRLVLALRRADGVDDVAAWIQLFRQALDGAALTGSVPSFQYDHHWPLLEIDLIPEFPQLDLSPRELLNVGAAVERTGKIQRFEHHWSPFRSPPSVSVAARSSASFTAASSISARGGAFGPRRFSSAAMMVSKIFFRAYQREVASTTVQGAYSDAVRSSICSTATRYLLCFLRRARSAAVMRQDSSGSFRISRKRFFCSFLLMWRKNFSITVPSSASMRSKSTMSW